MGEMWSRPVDARRSGRDDGGAWLETAGHATIAPARLERTLRLTGDEPVLRARYRITNLDVRPLPFVWGIHPAFAVTEAHRIDLPGRTMLVGVSSDAVMGEAGADVSRGRTSRCPTVAG